MTLLLEAQGLTFSALFANTQRVLGSAMYKADPSNYTFQDIKKNEFPGLKYVSYDTQTLSKESGKHYNTSIFFYNIDLKNGERPDLNSSVIRCSCSCPAYYFYFSYANRIGGVHARRPLRPYVRKTPPPPEGLPLRNPAELAGVCKHIAAFANFLSEDDYLFVDQPVAKAYKPFDTGIKNAFGQKNSNNNENEDSNEESSN